MAHCIEKFTLYSAPIFHFNAHNVWYCCELYAQCSNSYWETVLTVMFLKFSDSQVWANSADPDQTAPRGAV